MRYKINKGFIIQRLDDKNVIFDGEESMLYTFSETASFIFQKIKLGKEEKNIVDVLAKKYNISKQKAEKDVNDFVKELIRKKIIKK